MLGPKIWEVPINENKYLDTCSCGFWPLLFWHKSFLKRCFLFISSKHLSFIWTIVLVAISYLLLSLQFGGQLVLDWRSSGLWSDQSLPRGRRQGEVGRRGRHGQRRVMMNKDGTVSHVVFFNYIRTNSSLHLVHDGRPSSSSPVEVEEVEFVGQDKKDRRSATEVI